MMMVNEENRFEKRSFNIIYSLGFGAFGQPSGFGFGQNYGSTSGGGPMRRGGGGGGGRGGGAGAPYGRGGGRGSGGGFRGRNQQ